MDQYYPKKRTTNKHPLRVQAPPNEPGACTGPGQGQGEGGGAEALLRTEISFWREMLQSSHEGTPMTSVERMEYALALAECRLSKLIAHRNGDEPEECDGPAIANILNFNERKRRRVEP
jgi:hypothetical protein